MSKTSGLGTTKMVSDEGRLLFASIRDKFRAELPALVSAHMSRAATSSDLISTEEFANLYKSLWIHLDRAELSYISENFSSAVENNLNWTKFIKRLDILPPKDYVEPERHLDPLPEPLAGIVDILELEIIDRAWLEIIRLHPEIPIDDKGNPLVVRRNKNLEVLCPPSAMIKQQIIPCSLSSSGDHVFCCYDDGAVVLFSAKSGEESDSVNVFTEVVQQKSAHFSVKQLSNAVLVSTAGGDTVGRVAVCLVDEIAKAKVETAEVAPVANQKKAPPAKGKSVVVEEKPVVPERKFSMRIKLLETAGQLSTTHKGLHIICDELVCEVSAHDVVLDLSQDGDLLTVSHGDKCSVYYLSLKEESTPQSEKTGLAKVPEEKTASMDEYSPLFDLTLLAQLNLFDFCSRRFVSSTSAAEDVAFEKKEKFKHCYSFLLPQVSRPNALGKDSTADPKKPTSRFTDIANCVMKKYGLIIISDSFAEWSLVGFSPMLEKILPNVTTAAPSKGASAQASVLVSTDNSDILSTYRMNSWQLTGLVTSTVLDQRRNIISIGCADGTVTLWDLANRNLLSACGKHATSVTSLCFSEGISAFLLCSAAADGTVCFYSLKTAKVDLSLSFESPTQLIDVRQDVPKSSVVSLCPLVGSSIVLCSFSDGITAIYEAEAGDLLGKLVLYVGMLAQKMKSRPATKYELLEMSRTKPRPSVAIASIDDGEASELSIQQTFSAAPEDESLVAETAASNPVEEFFEHTKDHILCTAGNSGFYLFYLDVPKSGEEESLGSVVRTLYSNNIIIESVCPGIASLIKGSGRDSKTGAIPNASALYRMLSIEDRKNPQLHVSSIQQLLTSFIETDKKKSKNKAPALTMENLNALDNRELEFKPTAPRLVPMHLTSGSSALKTTNLGLSLIADLKRGQDDSAKRSKKVTNRLKQLSIILPTS